MNTRVQPGCEGDAALVDGRGERTGGRSLGEVSVCDSQQACCLIFFMVGHRRESSSAGAGYHLKYHKTVYKSNIFLAADTI